MQQPTHFLFGFQVSQGALNISKVGLTVALRYALTRRQFGPSEGKEILLMDFLSHQRRLLPLLAKQYALQFAMNRVKELYASNDVSSLLLEVPYT